MVAARGTSDNAARYLKYLFGAVNGLGVGLAVPSLYTLYGAPPRIDRALTIGISQSGQSPDVVAVLAEARRQGGLTLAITNDPDSPLAQAAHCCIELRTEERSVAATKTYTSQLMAIAMLSAALLDDPRRSAELEAVPHHVEQALERCPAEVARGFRMDRQFVVVSRGLNYCTAFEIALKMKETSYVRAEAYSVADFMHGPVAILEPGSAVVLVAPSGRAGDQAGDTLAMLQDRGARVVAISDIASVLARAELPIALPSGVPEWLSPISAVVSGQLWAWSLAITKQIDPDQPRGLSKVTLTT